MAGYIAHMHNSCESTACGPVNFYASRTLSEPDCMYGTDKHAEMKNDIEIDVPKLGRPLTTYLLYGECDRDFMT